jgi:micrococcal nuclease
LADKILVGIRILLIACAAVGIGCTVLLGEDQRPAQLPAGSALIEAQVTDVVDGDTLKVRIDGREETVRIIGVDTPETGNGYRPELCYGDEATARTEELVVQVGGQVLLEKDVSETDRYGRLLRYVWLPHSDGTRMLNEELVKAGYARAVAYPPDVKYQDSFFEAEQAATEQRLGLWGACSEFGAPAAMLAR